MKYYCNKCKKEYETIRETKKCNKCGTKKIDYGINYISINKTIDVTLFDETKTERIYFKDDEIKQRKPKKHIEDIKEEKNIENIDVDL